MWNTVLSSLNSTAKKSPLKLTCRLKDCDYQTKVLAISIKQHSINYLIKFRRNFLIAQAPLKLNDSLMNSSSLQRLSSFSSLIVDRHLAYAVLNELFKRRLN